ncbi:MAG: methyltransferase domain-containing protein [Planctomycetota bacterium]
MGPQIRRRPERSLRLDWRLNVQDLERPLARKNRSMSADSKPRELAEPSELALGVESYEQAGFWRPGESMSDHERGRVVQTLSHLPKDIDSLLDIGCGDGKIAHVLSELGRGPSPVQLDFSQKALELCRGPRVRAQVDRLPFADRAFDACIAAEVLEHLPTDILERTAKEMCRVARRYVFVTVPYLEFLPEHDVRCEHCSQIFNAWGHLHSFDEARLLGLFEGLRPRRVEAFGPDRTDYPGALLYLRQRLGGQWLRWDLSFCPACRQQVKSSGEGNLVARGCDFLYHRMQRWLKAKPTWLMGLFERPQS